VGLSDRLLIVLVALGLLAGCARSAPRPAAGPGAPAAPAAVDRFLGLAAQRNYVEMGWVFGTQDGPIVRRDPLAEVEKRMFALASVLENDGYVLGAATPVPGRTGSAMSFTVSLQRQGQEYQVPITAVRGPEGRWFVEQVAIEAITGRR
jgi:hypothetical protein